MMGNFLVHVIVLHYIYGGLVLANAFVLPITTLPKLNGQRQRPIDDNINDNPLIEMAAKKKKGKQKGSRSSPVTASGKGFGKSSNPSTDTDNAVWVDIGDGDVPLLTTTSFEPEIEESSDRVVTCSSEFHHGLLSYLQQCNPDITFINPKFDVQPSELGGYGGFATSSIQKDELIFRIPRECCVTYDDALNDIECPELFRMIKNERVPSWGMVLIAAWIAKTYLLAEYTNTNNSTTSTNMQTRIKETYLYSLPWKRGMLGQDHVVFWSDEEVETLLGGSLAYDDAMLIRNTVDNAVKLLSDSVVPTVLRDAGMNYDESSSDNMDDIILKDLEEAVRGAFVIALSRSFAEEVELDDGTVEVENLLLPVIDILQHSNTPNTILEPYEDYILLRARRDIGEGEELFHQYQEENDDVIPPHKFFTRYGFIPGVREPIAELLERRSSLFFDEDITNQ